jgi:hypothetical protein
LDPRLSSIPIHEVTHVFYVAMLCVEEQAVERPTMRHKCYAKYNKCRSFLFSKGFRAFRRLPLLFHLLLRSPKV